MTQHKCGTCRFYEAGAQHGSCRNPANPRRDDVALLRPDELGCRAGWGKDYWAAANAPADPGPLADADGDPTQPIPRVTGDAPSVSTTAALPPVEATPSASLARTRRGFQGPVVAPLSGMTQAPSAAKDAGVKRESPLENHPELNEQGIPYRNSSKRSSVAEAHRRALARRDKERKVKEEREQTRVSALTTQATAESGSVQPPVSAAAPPSAPARPPLAPNTRPELRPFTMKTESEPIELPQRPSIPLPAAPPRTPMMPRPVPEPPRVESSPVEPTRSIAAARDEAVDRVISNAAPPLVAEPVRETASTIPDAPIVSPAPTPAPQQTMSAGQPPVARAEQAESGGRNVSAPTEAAAKPPARYWHETTSGQYTRMDLPSAQGSPSREPSQVGRPRPEVNDDDRPAVTRRIRTMEEARNGLPVTPPPAASPAVQPPRMSPPRSAVPSQPAVAPSPTAEVAPRQIDEALLRQLETNWRTQELAAHAGQSCGNCRFFRPAEGGQGHCGCSFSNVYGRPIEPQGLGCLDGLGTWWAATDDGWLERTERRPRRATPLLDALLREREEELARSVPERRRAR